MDSVDKITKIKQQVEYYLSDKNLQNDKFFHEKINSDKDGFLEVAYLLNCNKIKELQATDDEIIAAATTSLVLETSDDKKRIRRKGNAPLPELSLLKKKKNKPEEEKEVYD